MNFIEAIKKSITKVRDDYHKRIYGYCGDELLIIPEGTTEIEDYYSNNLEGIQSPVKCVVMPNSVTAVPNYSFGYYFQNLEKIVFSKNLQSIGMEAFAQCLNLTEIKLPSSVTGLGMYAFGECTSLVKVDLTEYGTNKPLPTTDNCFGWGSAANEGFKIIVPHGRKEEFTNGTNWADYADTVVADITTDEIVNYATKEEIGEIETALDGIIAIQHSLLGLPTVSGVWRLNDELQMASLAEDGTAVEFIQDVVIETYNNTVDKVKLGRLIIQTFSPSYVYQTAVDLYHTTLGEWQNIYIDDPTQFDVPLWAHDEYKTWDFGSTPQVVSQEFYNWLVENATKDGETV